MCYSRSPLWNGAAPSRFEGGAGVLQMQAVVRFCLVLAAVIGLFAQNTASAAGPAFVTAIEAAAGEAAAADCTETMARKDGLLPCCEMTLACIASMGCMATFTASDPPAPSYANATAPVLKWPPLAVLQGRSIKPETHPPANLDRF